jgi:hypothetical protein
MNVIYLISILVIVLSETVVTAITDITVRYPLHFPLLKKFINYVV